MGLATNSAISNGNLAADFCEPTSKQLILCGPESHTPNTSDSRQGNFVNCSIKPNPLVLPWGLKNHHKKEHFHSAGVRNATFSGVASN